MTTQYEDGAVKWLVLPRLEVRGMNAQPAWWCVGAPGPMAARGLVQSLAETALGDGPRDVKGVGLIWHNFELRGEHLRAKPSSSFQEFLAHQHRAAAFINEDDYASGSKTLAGQPTVRGDGTVTLVVALASMASADLQMIEQRLDVGRLAGGAIVNHQFRVPRGDRRNISLRDMLIHEEWAGVMARIRTGHVFTDRSELIVEAMSAGAVDPLAAFLVCTQPEARSIGASVPAARHPRSSWLAPYLAGYYGLTPAKDRRMTRDGHPHAFVEPLVGLGQFLSVRETGVIPIWDYRTPGDGTYRVQEISCFGGTKPAAKVYVSRAATHSPRSTETRKETQ
jgi:CRISPR-associated protein Csy2